MDTDVPLTVVASFCLRGRGFDDALALTLDATQCVIRRNLAVRYLCQRRLHHAEKLVGGELLAKHSLGRKDAHSSSLIAVRLGKRAGIWRYGWQEQHIYIARVKLDLS